MVKYMDLKEFREKGYLQEVNRRFFHPLGLALEMAVSDDIEILNGIWDFRDDPDGIYYDVEHSTQKRKDTFKRKKEFIDEQFNKFKESRMDILGFDIEPVDED